MKAVYIGSFDPITNGHIDIIKRSLKQFPNLVIAIGDNPAKKCMFTIDERIQFIKNALKLHKIPDFCVEVTSFRGLAADFMYLNNINTTIRGVRNPTDIEYENHMYLINRQLAPSIDTVYIPCSPEYQTVSSSSVKMLVDALVDVSSMVTYEVKMHLEAKILNACFIGVVGQSGSGKSSFTFNVDAERFDFDGYVRSIWNKKSPYPLRQLPEDHMEYKKLFDNVASQLLGYDLFDISDDPCTGIVLNKERMRSFIAVPENNKIIRDAMRPAIDYLYRKDLRGKLAYWKSPTYGKPLGWNNLSTLLEHSDGSGVFDHIPTSVKDIARVYLLDAPMLVEYGGLSRVNNNVVIVNAPYEVKVQRLMKRDNLPEDVIKARLASQMTTDQLCSAILSEIQRTGFGGVEQCNTNGI